MREYAIKIEPFELFDLLELEINKEINEHVTAKVKGHINEENHNKYINLNNGQQWITISAMGESGNKKILFKGIIKNIKESVCSGLSVLEIEAVSGTYLSDISFRTRSFQDGAQTYGDVLNRIKSEENASCTSDTKLNINGITGVESPIKEFVVQYNETNWGFIKRLASHWNTYLVPEYKQEGCKFYFGRPDVGAVNTLKDYDYSVEKDIDEYRYKKRNNISGYTESDSMCYKVETREIYELCQQVDFKGRKLYIAKIETRLEKGELIHSYYLKSENGNKVVKYYNFKIIGASLQANIAEVKSDTVKVKIAIDNGNSKSYNRWYPYSTVYSSPDGTGWYFMPEKGDSVRVYFPNEKEDDAFIISSVHDEVSPGGGSVNSNNANTGSSGASSQSSGGAAPRSNPDNKSLSTKFGKQINFNPDNIEIISGEDLYIKITDGEGIEVISNASITLDAQEDIMISSGQNLYLEAGSGITIAKGTGEEGASAGESGKIEITEDREITLTGKDVKINS